MSATSDFRPGLEGVIAFETEIAEPDKDGGYLRYRGVDIEELVGHYPFENVWGLLVDEDINSPLPPTEAIHLQVPSGSVPADLQAALATLGPKWGMQKLVDIDDKPARDDLARLSSATLTIVAQAARGNQPAVPESEIEQGENAAAKFLIRSRGEADPPGSRRSTRIGSRPPSTASTPRPSPRGSRPRPAPTARRRCRRLSERSRDPCTAGPRRAWCR